jgi:hypothetical protein
LGSSPAKSDTLSIALTAAKSVDRTQEILHLVGNVSSMKAVYASATIPMSTWVSITLVKYGRYP